jgi:hypothetical protein
VRGKRGPQERGKTAGGKRETRGRQERDRRETRDKRQEGQNGKREARDALRCCGIPISMWHDAWPKMSKINFMEY